MGSNEKVIEIFGEVLGIDDPIETINMDSNIVDDLGAESIDFIDIFFQLERSFKIGKVKGNDIFPQALINETNFDDIKVKEILKDYPHINGDLFEEILENKDLNALLKVKCFVQFVDWRLANA